DEGAADVVNGGGGVVLIGAPSHSDRGDPISATVGHAARSADRGAGTIGFALAFIEPIRRDKQLIGAGSNWYHCQQQCKCQPNHGSFLSVISIILCGTSICAVSSACNSATSMSTNGSVRSPLLSVITFQTNTG